MSTARASSLNRMLFLRLRENRWSKPLERALGETPPGGVLLAEPLPRSIGDTQRLIAQICRACAAPVFIAIREEGGKCDPVSRYFTELPDSWALAVHGIESVERLANLIGEAMRGLGINTNFAPRLDLPSNPQMSASELGRDSALVTACGKAFVRGFARQKIFACGKHFPGEGSVPVGAAKQLPVSAKPMAALWREDLLPFRTILPQLPMVLVSAAAYKAYDFDLPRAASLSSLVVEGLLRTKLAYRGLALAYNLESEQVRGALTFGDAVVQSVAAGCDMVVVDQGERFEVVRRALQEGLNSKRLPEARTQQALRRIGAAMKRVPRAPRPAPARAIQNLQDRFRRFAEEFGHA
jgi:beta-N-acetylhexosaminidase